MAWVARDGCPRRPRLDHAGSFPGGRLVAADHRTPWSGVPAQRPWVVLFGCQVRAASTGEVLRRGVDSAAFSAARRSDALRTQGGADPGRPAVLGVGRVSREEGLGFLPSLSSALFRRGIPPRFVVVGDGTYRRALEVACPEAVFTGWLDHEAVAVAFGKRQEARRRSARGAGRPWSP